MSTRLVRQLESRGLVDNVLIVLRVAVSDAAELAEVIPARNARPDGHEIERVRCLSASGQPRCITAVIMQPGSGKRVMLGGMNPSMQESVHVAMSWAQGSIQQVCARRCSSREVRGGQPSWLRGRLE